LEKCNEDANKNYSDCYKDIKESDVLDEMKRFFNEEWKYSPHILYTMNGTWQIAANDISSSDD